MNKHSLQPRSKEKHFWMHNTLNLETGQLNIGKKATWFLNFCCPVQMIGWQFGMNLMKEWIHPYINSSGCWSCNCVDFFLALLNITVYPSIAADHVHHFMAAVYPSGKATSNRIIHHVPKLKHLKLVSWAWHWVHESQMDSKVNKSQSNKSTDNLDKVSLANVFTKYEW